eukprot:6197190-Pleurochrysis_carterae.AAC.3
MRCSKGRRLKIPASAPEDQLCFPRPFAARRRRRNSEQRGKQGIYVPERGVRRSALLVEHELSELTAAKLIKSTRSLIEAKPEDTIGHVASRARLEWLTLIAQKPAGTPSRLSKQHRASRLTPRLAHERIACRKLSQRARACPSASACSSRLLKFTRTVRRRASRNASCAQHERALATQSSAPFGTNRQRWARGGRVQRVRSSADESKVPPST